MDISLPIKLLISIVLGAVIGIERESSFETEEHHEKSEAGHLGGLRTYSLIALLGGIAGFLSTTSNGSLYLIITIAFFALVAIYYTVGGLMTRSVGLTTELGALFAFLVGFFVTSDVLPISLAIALTIIVSLILSVKEKSHSFILGVKRTEIDAFIGFAIVALVILPFLPNQSIFINDIPALNTLLQAYNVEISFLEKLEIINPFKLWFIVALITGIDVVGYILNKLTGEKKGLLMTSAVGGFISSTSTTQSLAQQSKSSTQINDLVSAAIVANLTSFLQVFVLVATLNAAWLITITPTLFIIVVAALATALFFHFKQEKGYTIAENEVAPAQKKTGNKRVFSLGPAVRFAILLITIRLATKVALALFGESGFLLSSVIASFTGIDAIVINLSELAGGLVTEKAALFTLIVINATNLLSKAGYSFFQAKREFTFKFLAASLFIITASFIGYWVI